MVKSHWQSDDHHPWIEQASAISDCLGSPGEVITEANSTGSWKPKLNLWLWLFLGLGVSCGLGAVATIAFQQLTALPPTTNCQDMSPLSPDIDRLYCAQDAARSGELTDLMTSLAVVDQWTPAHPLYAEAQRWMTEWSTSVLTIAQQKIHQYDFESAITLAERIPQSSPVYEQAQSTIAEWRQQWQSESDRYAQAQEAVRQQDWDTAFAHLSLLRESPYDYWSQHQADALSQQIQVEKQARQVLAKAKQLVQGWELDGFKQAIERVNQINADTFTRQEAQPLLTEWGNVLLTVGLEHWQAGELEEGIALARIVVANPELEAEAQRLITLSEARRLAMTAHTFWEVNPKHIWNYLEATAAVQQIPPESRFYTEAQDSLTQWHAQMADVIQLQYAQVLADWQQPGAFQAAIAQAQQIPPSAPRRIQAQTLVAHWSSEVERIADRPILEEAQQLATTGTIADLNAAITVARQIPLGRALRGEAQGLIYAWTRQIETIEDQPLLAEARTQANRGNWQEAIQTASEIGRGRALYEEAQGDIASWRAEQDRLAARTRRPQPILERIAPERSEPLLERLLESQNTSVPDLMPLFPTLDQRFPPRRSPTAPQPPAPPVGLPVPAIERAADQDTTLQPAPDLAPPASPNSVTSGEDLNPDRPLPIAPEPPQLTPPPEAAVPNLTPLNELPLPVRDARETAPEPVPANPPSPDSLPTPHSQEPANPFDASLLPDDDELFSPLDASLLPIVAAG